MATQSLPRLGLPRILLALRRTEEDCKFKASLSYSEILSFVGKARTGLGRDSSAQAQPPF